MSVHYKFKSALEYDTVTFDGLHISVKDLKNAIIQQKRIGKNTDFDLQVTNAQTKEVYEDGNALIPKNTSLLIARIPTSVQNKSKNWEGYGGDSTPPTKLDDGGPIAKAVDLSSLDAPEDDKISAMMSQSTQDYDPSNYMKIRGANQMGAVPPNYRCYKCHQAGHWIKDCPLGQGPEPIEIKKSTGIPRSFMVPVEGPQVPGAMMTPNGSYAVPVLDHQAYTQVKSTGPIPVQEPKPEIPEDLVCSICSDLLIDAVMIPCCGNSFCDECIRSCLLESADHECLDCHEKYILPGTLIPNRYLRNSVKKFKNTTGYVKKPVYKQKQQKVEVVESQELAVPKKEITPPPQENSDKVKSDIEEKTVISEADSTEHSKNTPTVPVDFPKIVEVNIPAKLTESSESISEGPPGVSPKHSPKQQRISNRVNSSQRERTSRHHKSRPNEQSPRKVPRNRRSPTYGDAGEQEDRPGTPTVDEPGMGNYRPPSNASYSNAPPGTIPTMIGIVPPTIQAPPPNIAAAYPQVQPQMGGYAPPPPTHGPPPNFRLPPPGTAPPYLPPGAYPVAPRPIFDTTRPPMTGPPPGLPPNFPSSSRPHHSRDFPRGRIRETPPGVIDDPLAAFNRMLREKDERERRIKQRNMRRSYSRSRSRSRSYSRSPRRMRSRSPRRRQSRSRSRSFSISRSRSRSYSGGSIRGSPYRQLSPPPRRSPLPLPPRRGPSRYRSPIRSPPRHHRQGDRQRDRDFDHNRDYPRDERPSFNKDNHRGRDNRSDDRDNRYFDNYDDRRGGGGGRGPGQWGQQGMSSGRGLGNDGGGYYPDMQQQGGYQQTNRYPPPQQQQQQRHYPPYMNNKNEPQHIPPLIPPQHLPMMQQQRRYEDIAPPGVEEPPIPGLENIPRFDRYDRPPSEPPAPEKFHHHVAPKEEPKEVVVEKRDERKRRHEKRSRTPEKLHRNPSPKRKDSPDKHKRRRKDASSEREDKEKKRDHSDDDKSRKSKDKRKRKDRKDSEKKRKKDKKEKHRKDDKEKKPKEEFKQVIVREAAEVKKVEVVVEEKRHKMEEKKDNKMEVSAEQLEELEAPKQDLYDDVLSEGVDKKVVENYGKIDEPSEERNMDSPRQEDKEPSKENTPEEDHDIGKDYEDSEKDILELHSTDMDLKVELDKSEFLAPVPEKSKWEVEEDNSGQASPKDASKTDSKSSEKSAKVTNEVLKRAENAIFAKAINAIRPIEIKKISTDRAKLYSGEREVEKSETTNRLQVTVPVIIPENKKPEIQPVRLSIKERLGIKVDDDGAKIERNNSRSLSPFSKRGDTGRNYERRVEVEERSRHRRSRSKRRESSRDRHRNRGDNRRDTRRDDHRRTDRRREGNKHEDKEKIAPDQRSKSKVKEREKQQQSELEKANTKTERKKRSRSRSETSADRKDSKDKRKKRDKRQKKEKPVKKQSTDGKEEENKEVPKEKSEISKPARVASEKRKPTLDEANFEPDYDLESESDKELTKVDKTVESAAAVNTSSVKKRVVEEKTNDKDSSSSESSSDSSDDDRKKKKHKKHRKKKKKDSSSSSSDSDSDSSDDDRDKRRKKHKKKQKKRKKSKHK